VPSWLYLILEQTLIYYICFGVIARPGKARKTAREQWEQTHPYMKWEDWKNR
jgi:hypothetical protein